MSPELRLMIVLFLIGLIFGSLGAIMAFVITYQEYCHHYLDKRDTFRTAMKSAVFTFVVFLVLSVFLAIFLRKIIS
jgi:hypothetical protein